MATLDIFSNDPAFNLSSLTDAINDLAFVPSRINGMGLFAETPVNTTTIMIEQRHGVLTYVPRSPRGGVGHTIDKQKRKMRSLAVPHFQRNDSVMAEEVQGVRAFGTETEVQTVMGIVANRMQEHVQDFNSTQEFSRMGAIKGIVTYLDDDGEVDDTLNLFSTFGVTQESEIDFDLDATDAGGGDLREKCMNVTRQVGRLLGGTPFTGLHAFCGDEFFNALIKHPEVRETYLNWQAAEELRGSAIAPTGATWGAFPFGGIVFENYKGFFGEDDFVATDKCHIFPVGVPGLFRTYYAPADYMETVNTMGQRLYAKQFPMPNDKGINMEIQSNFLDICTRPKVLLQGAA